MINAFELSAKSKYSHLQFSIDRTFVHSHRVFPEFPLIQFYLWFFNPGLYPEVHELRQENCEEQHRIIISRIHVIAIPVLYSSNSRTPHNISPNKGRLFVLVAWQADPKIVCIFCHIMKYNIRLHMVNIHR